ncbi:hypothetical protein K432DRAFT_399746 [Lepidopterella palustris CBS 459.81]|uniref:Uncharacterized protein n=1 Tax=Lepidopterella palustris CBS 459.81 TaxID=1314670 RepID=A0A8E2EL51_9PEZI|nr:hypothetical protein K432DRAFT_399746 [Lepidopterella palustris CBS 459.81]
MALDPSSMLTDDSSCGHERFPIADIWFDVPKLSSQPPEPPVWASAAIRKPSCRNSTTAHCPFMSHDNDDDDDDDDDGDDDGDGDGDDDIGAPPVLETVDDTIEADLIAEFHGQPHNGAHRY